MKILYIFTKKKYKLLIRKLNNKNKNISI